MKSLRELRREIKEVREKSIFSIGEFCRLKIVENGVVLEELNSSKDYPIKSLFIDDSEIRKLLDILNSFRDEGGIV